MIIRAVQDRKPPMIRPKIALKTRLSSRVTSTVVLNPIRNYSTLNSQQNWNKTNTNFIPWTPQSPASTLNQTLNRKTLMNKRKRSKIIGITHRTNNRDKPKIATYIFNPIIMKIFMSLLIISISVIRSAMILMGLRKIAKIFPRAWLKQIRHQSLKNIQ